MINSYISEISRLPDNALKLHFSSDHGEPTPLELYQGEASAIAASMICICMSGVPHLFHGQEVGNPYGGVPIDWMAHPDMRPIYQQLLAVYHEHNVLKYGGTEYYPISEDILLFTRSLESETLLIAVNVRDEERTLTLPLQFAESQLMDIWNDSIIEGYSITMHPYGSLIMTVD